MTIYLICNNLLSNNIIFDRDLDLEKKKEIRPLSIDGVKKSVKIKLKNVSAIYSSTYVSCLETAKYLSEKNNVDILITDEFNDCKVGDLKRQSIKMLSYMQEHDFNFKQPGGETLNECCLRIDRSIEKVKRKKVTSAVFIPRRAMLAYLLKYTKQDFNLDERLVLFQGDNVIMENTEDDIEIIKLDFVGEDVKINSIKL